MSVYFLLKGQSTTVSPAGNISINPPVIALPPPPSPGTGSPVVNQGFQIDVQAPGGVSVGCVVSIVASNDYVSGSNVGNWGTVSTVTIASAAGPQTSLFSLALPHNAWGAFLPTITGAGATVTCLMSA